MSVAETIFADIKDRFARGTAAEADFQAYLVGLTTIEDTYFDFKTSSGLSGNALGTEDEKNLAKGVSGFANTSGGVLIWGVQDKTGALRPIPGITEFTARIVDRVSKVTDPPTIGVQSAHLLLPNGTGYAAILVPMSDLPPHQVITKVKDIQFRYFMRSASDFAPMPHSLLEDKFGRRPRPKLEILHPQVSVFSSNGMGDATHWALDLSLRNTGRGTARDIAFRISAKVLIGSPGDFGFGIGWSALFEDEAGGNIMAPEFRTLYPGTTMRLRHISVRNFSAGGKMRLFVRVYAEGMLPLEIQEELTIPAKTVGR